MSKDKNKLDDQEIAERGGMGNAAEDEEKDPTELEESDESEDEEESDESEEDDEDESEDDDEESEADDEESDDEEEEADDEEDDESEEEDDAESEDDSEEEDEDEDDDDSEDDEDDDDKSGRRRTVPYGKLKAERKKRKEMQGQIKDIFDAIAELRADRSGTDEDEERGELEKEAERLGKELGQDSKALAKVLKATVDLARKEFSGKKLPKDLEDKLKLLDKVQAREKEERESSHFNKEWEGLTPALKKRFPNASASMIAEAKKAMDELSHSKKYHRYDLDYILYKEGKRFTTMLKAAPGSRSGEGGKQIGAGEEGYEETGDSDENLVDIEDMTPEIMRGREKKDVSRRSRSRRDDDVDMQINEPIEE